MPVKTVTLQVAALTDSANRQIAATGAYFDALRAKNPVELTVKLNRAQAIAESRILAKEMATVINDTVKLNLDGGLITRLLSRGGTGGVLGLVGRAGGGGLGALGIGAAGALGVPALGAVAAGALGIIPALVAAGAGVAAFGALAIPTFTAVTGAISGVSAANAKFQEAAQNVDIAISTSAADLKLYNTALAAMPSNLRSAAILLGNQSVTWQGLTTAQQNNVIALSQNKSALSSLLPAQRTALTQLLNSKAVWDQLSPAQQKIATGWQNMTTQYQNLATALAPDVLKILNSGLQLANNLLPSLLPLAKVAGDALSGLASHAASFFQTTTTISVPGSDKIRTVLTPFGEFMKTLTALSGPAITAIGEGIGKIAVSLGKLLLSLASPSAIRDLKVFFEIVAGAISALASFFDFATPRWNNNIRSMTNFGRTMVRVFEDARAGIERDFVQVLVRFFTSTLPTAFDIMKESVRIAFDQIAIFALKTVYLITGAFGKLPSFLGAPFRKAHADIGRELLALQGDSANAVANIKADFAKLNGTSANLFVYTNFVNIGTPPTIGGILPTPSGLPPGVVRVGHAAGTMSASPGWAWVGERGPELAYFRGGETVIPSSVARGYAGGTGGAQKMVLEVRGAPRNEADAFMVSWLKRLIASGQLSVQMAP